MKIKLIDLIKEQESKIYVQTTREVPKGKKLNTGPRGGKYFMGSAEEKQQYERGEKQSDKKEIKKTKVVNYDDYNPDVVKDTETAKQNLELIRKLVTKPIEDPRIIKNIYAGLQKIENKYKWIYADDIFAKKSTHPKTLATIYDYLSDVGRGEYQFASDVLDKNLEIPSELLIKMYQRTKKVDPDGYLIDKIKQHKNFPANVKNQLATQEKDKEKQAEKEKKEKYKNSVMDLDNVDNFEIVKDQKDFNSDFQKLVLSDYDNFAATSEYIKNSNYTNNSLRKGKETKESKIIDKIFDKIKPIKKDMTIHRGFSLSNENLKDILKKKKFINKAFTSTTVDKETAGKFAEDHYLNNRSQTPVVMTVKVPKGSKVLEMNEMLPILDDANMLDSYESKSFSGEGEILLNRDSKFKIVKANRDGETVHLECIYLGK